MAEEANKRTPVGLGVMQAAIAKAKQNKENNEVNKVKGVSGFRPVINYRDMAIRRKKLKDKQILICILMSGTAIILIGIGLLFLGLFVINRECPFEYQTFNDEKCLYISSHNATWASARDFCSGQGGNLVDVSSPEENDEIKARLKGETWIALFRPRQQTEFKWASGISDTYRNWVSSPSGGAPSFTQCVWMDETTGKWTVENDCSRKLYGACEYSKSYYPLVLVGPIVIGCGIIVLILSIEVCQRYRKSRMRGNGLLDDEELPEEDTAHLKKTMASDHGHVLSWRNTNKTSPLGFIPSKSTMNSERDSQQLLPISETNQEISPLSVPIPSIEMPENVPTSNKTPISSSRISQDTKNNFLVPFLDDQSKSQEQLELLLTPKNLH